jgi:outer membrane lipoprotein SlyB
MMIKQKSIALLICTGLTGVSLLSACAPNISSSTYTAGEVGVTSKAESGIIVSTRPVTIDNQTAAGGAVGTAAGAVTGVALAGHNDTARILAGLGGAVVGGLAGNAVDKSIHKAQGTEYIVKLKSGRMISITQTNDTVFSVNQHVIVIFNSLSGHTGTAYNQSMARIVPDNSGK